MTAKLKPIPLVITLAVIAVVLALCLWQFRIRQPGQPALPVTADTITVPTRNTPDRVKLDSLNIIPIPRHD